MSRPARRVAVITGAARGQGRSHAVALAASYAHADNNIRVNSVHPTGVATPMIFNEHMARMFEANPEGTGMSGNLLDVPYVEPADVTNAVLFLISDAARYVTGKTMPVDAGFAVM
jgi:NAD(P)-dependent dehydrogenase (short-subunit alcohol dehydrogenase family)